ncbi:hydrogenase biosynthesis protein HybE, partial [Aeromonas sp. HMWF016]
ALVSSTLKMLLSLPVQQGAGGVDLGRRRLFGARRGQPA